ncbi:MAG: DUF4143 domain-containing protein [Bacteriovorax sp.]|nr:DUF4143 domain-containing protein [Bacteriovorax sp.]
MRSPNDLKNHSMRGAIFENLMIVDIMKEHLYQGEDVKFYYMRDAKGVEIDLVYKKSPVVNLFEIKSGMTVNDDFFAGLSKFGQLFEENNYKTSKFILYSGEWDFEKKDTLIFNYRNFKI